MRKFTLLLALAATSIPAAAQTRFEKTIPVPRRGDAALNWSVEGCRVESVTLRNYPDEDEIEKARREDPNDKSWVWWEFNVENRGTRKCRIRLWVEVLDKNGQVLKSSDRSDTVEAGKLDDDIRVSTRMKTLEIADAPKARLSAEIGPK